jgi:hypothetical protein
MILWKMEKYQAQKGKNTEGVFYFKQTPPSFTQTKAHKSKKEKSDKPKEKAHKRKDLSTLYQIYRIVRNTS